MFHCIHVYMHHMLLLIAFCNCISFGMTDIKDKLIHGRIG